MVKSLLIACPLVRVFDMKDAPIYDTDFDDKDLVEVSSLSYCQEMDKNWDTYKVFDKIPCLENNMQLNIFGQHLPTLFNKTPQRVDSFSIKSSHIHVFNFVCHRIMYHPQHTMTKPVMIKSGKTLLEGN